MMRRKIMMSSNTNNNGKSGKRPAFHHSKNSRGMKLLYHPSTVIEHGIYAGLTFGYVLERYGKKAFIDLLKYYRISSRIMMENHCTLKPHKERTQEESPVQATTNVSLAPEDSPVATDVTAQIDNEALGHDTLNTTDHVELDDDRWTVSRSDYENDVLYDPEDDVPDSYLDELLAGGGMAHSRTKRNWGYWDNPDY
jgi:hypothetical protein